MDPTQPRRGWQRKPAHDPPSSFRSQAGPIGVCCIRGIPSSRDPTWTLSHSGSSSRRLRSPCLFMPAPAGVGVPLTSLATPCSMRKCRGLGATWLGAGECCCPCLPGSWGQCENQSGCGGHGLGCLQPFRRSLRSWSTGFLCGVGPTWTMVSPLSNEEGPVTGWGVDRGARARQVDGARRRSGRPLVH